MDAVLRGLAIYLVLLLLFRLAGKRSLRQATNSDLLLLLFVGEVTQQALVSREFSLRIVVAIIIVLFALSRVLDFMSTRSKRDQGDRPLVLVDNGEALHDRMGQARLTPEDIMFEARESHGLQRMEQIEYAVLGKSGSIAIIPRVES